MNTRSRRSGVLISVSVGASAASVRGGATPPTSHPGHRSRERSRSEASLEEWSDYKTRWQRPGPVVPWARSKTLRGGPTSGAVVHAATPISARSQRIRRLLPSMRALLVVFSVLTALAVGALYVLAERTSDFFAWTIQPPLTAAFLGAGYAAGFVLVVLSLRDPVWAHSRVAVLTILAFVVLTTIATFLHIDRFHFMGEFAGSGFAAKAAAWFWLTVYVVVPVLMLLLLLPQERSRGIDPAPRHPVPLVLRIALALESVVLTGTGLALFVVPATSERLWPWPLTP